MHLSTSDARASSQPPTTITPAGFLVHSASTVVMKAPRSTEVGPAIRTMTLSAFLADSSPGYTPRRKSGRFEALLIHTYSWSLRLGSPIGTSRPVGAAFGEAGSVAERIVSTLSAVTKTSPESPIAGRGFWSQWSMPRLRMMSLWKV